MLLSVKTASYRAVNTYMLKTVCVHPVTKFVPEVAKNLSHTLCG